ncbi:MAG: hypothetical protein Kow0077_08740 [Anaerolineae bacterium]
MMHRFKPLLLLAILSLFALFPAPALRATAQGPCGVVDAIDYPLPTDEYHVVYEYGVPSSRFDGRYHAGEDWFGSRQGTYGTPVRAIARGRVTYAAPFGWGQDKGVVIIEHLMPDGTWWYSLYGHMEEVGEHTFPTVYTCVNKGDIIGAIGRPRPAPHLHLEIRNFGPDSPGPGYWATDPAYSGWRNPGKFIKNWQAWLNPAHLWHADIADETGPHFPAIIRPDNAMIVYDDGRLRALNPAGQVLWRYVLAETLDVVAVLPYDGAILVADSSGILQRWSLEGGFIEQWRLPSAEVDSVLLWQNLLIYRDRTSEELVALGPDRAERWRVPGIKTPVQIETTTTLLGIAAVRGELTLVGPDGRVIDQRQLESNARLAPAPDGSLIVFSDSLLWRVDAAGTWQPLGETPRVNRITGGLFSLPDGRFLLYTGQPSQTLLAYGPDGSLQWQTTLDGRRGRPFLLPLENDPLTGMRLVLADGSGAITLLRADTGAICGTLAVWGSRGAQAWAAVGPDGVLRVHIADQVIGLDTRELGAGC